MELPPWLDETFIVKVLQGGELKNRNVRVLKFFGSPAVAAGNNYMSKMYKVRVNYSVEDQQEELSASFMVKAPITKGFVSEVKDTFDIYATEPKMYRELLPKINEKIKMEFGPKHFDCSVKDVLVFNDLTQEGYIMCDKFKQLDFAHCKFALETLAKFHATSVACHKDNPSIVEELGTENFNVGSEFFEQAMKPSMENGINFVAEILRELERETESVEYLLSKVSTVVDSLVSFCKPKVIGLNVLNHADFWVNNMLFKHDEHGDIVDIKMIDFQVLRYNSPASDLIYFLWSSANKDVREGRLQELLDIYLQTLNDTLQNLGMDEKLSSEELQEDLLAGECLAVLNCCNLMPFVLCEPKNAVSMEEFKIEDMKTGTIDERLLKVFKGSNFISVLPDLIKHLRKWVYCLKQKI